MMPPTPRRLIWRVGRQFKEWWKILFSCGVQLVLGISVLTVLHLNEVDFTSVFAKTVNAPACVCVCVCVYERACTCASVSPSGSLFALHTI